MFKIGHMNFNIPENQKNIAVALSGGGDSMALAHMICAWAKDSNAQIHLLSVDHNLRAESRAECEQVAQWVNNFSNATYTILTWEYDERPDTAVMEKARTARYDLMHDYCVEHDIQTLCVGHHGDDQIETFFFRLAKGSGLNGLTGMKEWSKYNDLQIYRPLLKYSHADLIQYCKDQDLQWIEDPSNQNEDYARPRLRKALENEGFETARFAKTINRLSRAQDAIDWLVEQTEQEVVHDHEIHFDKLKKYPLDIQIRVLQNMLNKTGKTTHNYPPKLERVEDILATIKPSQSATLHGCLITRSKDGKTLEIKGA